MGIYGYSQFNFKECPDFKPVEFDTFGKCAGPGVKLLKLKNFVSFQGPFPGIWAPPFDSHIQKYYQNKRKGDKIRKIHYFQRQEYKMPYKKSASKPPRAMYRRAATTGAKDFTKKGMKIKRGSMGTKYKSSHNPAY